MGYDFIVFTDGSSFPTTETSKDKRPNNEKIEYNAGSGVVVLDIEKGEKYINKKTLDGRTNNYSELYAVAMALNMISEIKKRSGKKYILVIADSAYVIDTFRENIYKWAEGKRKTDTWKNSSGVVKNQDLIKYVYYNYLEDSDYVFTFIHMNSHKNEDNVKQVKIMKKKLQNQGLKVDDETVKTFIRYNKEVDELAESAVTKIKKGA